MWNNLKISSKLSGEEASIYSYASYKAIVNHISQTGCLFFTGLIKKYLEILGNICWHSDNYNKNIIQVL